MDSSNTNSAQINELPLNEDLEEISIKVKTIDSNEYLVNTNKDSSVSDLKQKIEQVSFNFQTFFYLLNFKIQK